MKEIQILKNYALKIGFIVLSVLLTGCEVQSVEGRNRKLTAVSFTDVTVADEFWAPRIETNRKISIPHAFRKCEETGRISNFAKAGGLMKGKHEGAYFNDSDVYKIIEGAAYALKIHPDPKLEKYVDGVIDKIAAAQWEDGYLYTFYSLPKRQPEKRWTNIGSMHELYCAGHFFEAAVAYYQATGKRKALDVAIRFADYINSVFGPDKKHNPPGHQEIEIALVKLYRVTGDRKYLDLAKFFLDQRGYPRGRGLYGTYSQDHKPVIQQDEAVGHAVRACYMYSGMADVAMLTADTNYLNALDRIWQNVVYKQLYLTGAIGARGGHEGFGDKYQLPNLAAYCETCAAIANAMWNYRMFLAHGDAKYVDVLERIIYNGFLSGISLKGNRFFYPNPLESNGQHGRSPWFGCACCPSNVVRFVPSVGGYVYASRADNVYVNLFIGGTGTIKTQNNTVQIEQQTRYPWDGAVNITVNPKRSGRFAVCVRIPGWAQNQPLPSDLYRYMGKSNENVTLKVNGKPIAIEMENGFARIRRKWRKGDKVELDLPMPIRRVLAHEKVEDDKGRAALQRGPIVYCAEWPDNERHAINLLLPDDSTLKAEYRADMLNGVEVITGKAFGLQRDKDGETVLKKQQNFLAIPYYAWAHRGRGEMAVWLARDMSAAKPLPGPTIAYTSKVTISGRGDIKALNDQLEPRSSIDHSNRFFHWWPRKGTKEWVQYELKKPEKVSSVKVYWFDDTGIGECRAPKSWRLLYRDGNQWKEVPNPSNYGVEKDKYNEVTFGPVKTNGLRLEIQLPDKFSAGIHEWIVK